MLKMRTMIIILSALLILAFVGCSLKDSNGTSSLESNSAPSTEQTQSESNPSNEIQSPSNNELGIDLFVVPDMTDEQQAYCTDYVNKLLYSGLLIVNWSVDDYSSLVGEQIGRLGNYMMYAFEDIKGQDGMQKLFDEYKGIFPAGVIEDILLIRFPFTAEQLHEILSDIYHAETNTYHYEGGRGGGPIGAAVVGVDDSGEFVRLNYEIYSGYSGLDIESETFAYKLPGVLTLKQNVFGGYTFWSVEVGEQIEAPIVAPNRNFANQLRHTYSIELVNLLNEWLSKHRNGTFEEIPNHHPIYPSDFPSANQLPIINDVGDVTIAWRETAHDADDANIEYPGDIWIIVPIGQSHVYVLTPALFGMRGDDPNYDENKFTLGFGSSGFVNMTVDEFISQGELIF